MERPVGQEGVGRPRRERAKPEEGQKEGEPREGPTQKTGRQEDQGEPKQLAKQTGWQTRQRKTSQEESERERDVGPGKPIWSEEGPESQK